MNCANEIHIWYSSLFLGYAPPNFGHSGFCIISCFNSVTCKFTLVSWHVCGVIVSEIELVKYQSESAWGMAKKAKSRVLNRGSYPCSESILKGLREAACRLLEMSSIYFSRQRERPRLREHINTIGRSRREARLSNECTLTWERQLGQPKIIPNGTLLSNKRIIVNPVQPINYS